MTEQRHDAPDHRPAFAMLGSASAPIADAFLEEQTRLTRLQIEELRKEDVIRHRSLRINSISDTMKLAFEFAIAFIVLAVFAGIVGMVWSAAHDNGLVVESFSVPADLAGRGLTGDVVAARLLDRLAALQARTVSHRAASSYANNWGNDIKVQIPQTGVSIGEVDRYLRDWLGHRTHISGEIYRTATGIAVTARAGGDAGGATFAGSDADLDALLQRAAEAVYAQTQPYRYAVYLTNVNRAAEAETIYRNLITGGSPQERAWAYIGLGNAYQARGDLAGALRAMHSALAFRPNFVMAWLNIAPIEGQLQHDEAALAAQRKTVALLLRGNDPDISNRSFAIDVPAGQAALAADLGDFLGQTMFDRQLESLPDFNNQVANARQADTVAYGFLHDGAAVRQVATDLAANGARGNFNNGNLSFAEFLMGDPAPLLAQRAAFEAQLLKAGPVGRAAAERQLWPVMSYALALTGDLRGAHALIDRTPVDCVICLRMRGYIDTVQKNWAGAAYWFARAAGEAPSTPFPLADWGRMLLLKGDYDAAIAKFADANRNGPHFADPLEMWGEALMLQNRSDLALAKFAEAARYAPNWGRLHMNWGEALAYAGRTDEAKAQFAVAAALHLTPTERASLKRARARF